MNMNMNWYGEKQGMLKFRKHLLWYTRGLRGGARFRQAVSTSMDAALILREVHDFFHIPEKDTAP